jgi:hypothetical protein
MGERQKGKRQEQFFSGGLRLAARRAQRIGLFLRQKVFFLPKGSRQTNQRDEALDLTSALHDSVFFGRNSHRAAGQRAEGVDPAAAVFLQRGTGHALVPLGLRVDVFVGPPVDERIVPELGGRGCHRGDLVGRPLCDGTPSILRERWKSILNRLLVEEGDGEQSDAAAMATRPARQLIEQRGAGPLKPAGGLRKQARRIGEGHGTSIFDGDRHVDNQLAFR